MSAHPPMGAKVSGTVVAGALGVRPCATAVVGRLTNTSGRLRPAQIRANKALLPG